MAGNHRTLTDVGLYRAVSGDARAITDSDASEVVALIEPMTVKTEVSVEAVHDYCRLTDGTSFANVNARAALDQALRGEGAICTDPYYAIARYLTRKVSSERYSSFDDESAGVGNLQVEPGSKVNRTLEFDTAMAVRRRDQKLYRSAP